VSTYDKNNVTPIHLAVKNQLSTIVKLLLDHGADAKVSDNQNMNPFHYMSQGKIVECKPKQFVRPLIPNESIKINSRAEMKNATNVIIEILNNDKMRKFTTHIKNSLKLLPKIFMNEFEEGEKKIIQDISDIVSDSKLGKNEMKSRINIKMEEFTKYLMDYVGTEMKTTLKPLDVRPIQERGWGPTDNTISKILGEDTYDRITNINAAFTTNKQKLMDDITKDIDALTKQMIDNTENRDKFYTDIADMMMHNYNVYVNNEHSVVGGTNVSNFVDWTQLAQIITTVTQENLIFEEINIMTEQESYVFNVKVIDDSSNNFGIFNNDASNTGRKMDGQLFYFNIPNNHITTAIRGTKTNRKNWKDGKTLTEPVPLTINIPPNVLSNVTGANRKKVRIGANIGTKLSERLILSEEIEPQDPLNLSMPAFNKIYYSVNTLPYLLKNKIADDNPYYFVSKCVFAIDQINKHIRLIQMNLNHLLKLLDVNYYEGVYPNLMVNILESLLNCIQNINIIRREEQLIKNQSQKLYVTFNNKFNENKNINYSYSLEYASDIGKNIYDDCYKKINENMSLLYSILLNVHEKLNRTINVLNNASVLQYIQLYFGDKQHPKEINDDANIQLANLFDNNIKLFNTLPKSLNEYLEKYSNIKISNELKIDIHFARQKIIKDFIPIITNKNYQTFYSLHEKNTVSNQIYESTNSIIYDTTTERTNVERTKLSTIEQKPKIGYLYYYENKSTIGMLPPDLNSTIVNNFHIDYPEIPYGPISINFGELDSTITNNGAFDKYIGQIGTIPIDANNERSRRDAIIPSVGSYLGEYMNIMKIYLIQNIIAFFNDKSSSGIPKVADVQILSTDLQNKLTKTKDGLYNVINDNGVNSNDEARDAIVYSIVGKLADELIRNTISYSLQSSISKFVHDIVNKKFKNEMLQDIIINPSSGTTQQILHFDLGFKVNFSKLFDDIVVMFLNGPINDNSSYMGLKYTGKLMNDEIINKEENQYKIYNENYTSDANIIDECYKLEPQIIKMLSSGRADINQKDSSGSTPIQYAIDTLYPELVRVFIKHGAYVYNSKIQNYGGLTPYQHGLNLYEQHNAYLCKDGNDCKYILSRFCDPLFKTIKENMMAKKEYGNNIIYFLDILFPQMLMMYNNQFYMHINNYINNWSYEKSTDLLKLLNKYGIMNVEIFEKVIPLFNVDNVGAIKNNDVLNPLLTKENELNKNDENIQKLMKEYTNRSESLKKELDHYNNKLKKDNIDNEYIKRLEEKINEVNLYIINLNNKKTNNLSTYATLNANVTNRVNFDSSNLNMRVKNFIGSSGHVKARSVSKMYDNLFNSAVSNVGILVPDGLQDYRLYEELWSKYIKSDKNDITNIHMILVLLQSQIIKNMKQRDEIDTYKKDFDVIKSVYDDIFIFTIDNSRNLPQKYNYGNAFLKDQLDIIVHCTKHVIFANMYSVILRTIVEYVKSLNPNEYIGEKIDDTDINNLIRDSKDDDNKMTSDNINLSLYDPNNYPKFLVEVMNRFVQYNHEGTNKKPELKKYIIDDMPKMIIKKLLDIYDDTDDYEDNDRNLDSIDELFNNIATIIMRNPVVPVKIDSTLIVNINNYVIPYYKEIIIQVIPAMKKIMDNYNRFIMNDSRHIDIMKELIDRAVTEVNLR